MDLLMSYHWPGNVREIMNLIERATILAETNTIEPKDLPLPHVMQSGFFEKLREKKSLQELEIDYIKWVLSQCGNNRKKAAQILKIDPKTLYRKLKNTERSDWAD